METNKWHSDLTDEQELDSRAFNETSAQWLDYNINNKKNHWAPERGQPLLEFWRSQFFRFGALVSALRTSSFVLKLKTLRLTLALL